MKSTKHSTVQRTPFGGHLAVEIRSPKQYQITEMTLTYHPEAKPKELANEKEILPFALRKESFGQNDSFAVSFENLSI